MNAETAGRSRRYQTALGKHLTDLRLLTLMKTSKVNTASLKKEIAKTQRLVRESIKRLDRFAHEFCT
jgi:hypothetical protein